jgi:hypothetical protein
MAFRIVRLRYTLLLLLRHFMAARIQQWWLICHFRWLIGKRLKKHANPGARIAYAWRCHVARTRSIEICLSDAHIGKFCKLEEAKYASEYETNARNQSMARHLLKRRGVQDFAQLLLQSFMTYFHRSVWHKRNVHEYMDFEEICAKSKQVVESALDPTCRGLQAHLMEYRKRLDQWKVKSSWMQRFLHLVHSDYVMDRDGTLPNEAFTRALDGHNARCNIRGQWTQDVWYPRLAAQTRTKPSHADMSVSRAYYERLHWLGNIKESSGIFRFHSLNYHTGHRTDQFRDLDFELDGYLQDCARQQILQDVESRPNEVIVTKIAIGNTWLRCREIHGVEASYAEFMKAVLLPERVMSWREYLGVIEHWYLELIPASQFDYATRGVKERIMPTLKKVVQSEADIARNFYLYVLKGYFILEDLLGILWDDMINVKLKQHPTSMPFLAAIDKDNAKRWYASIGTNLKMPPAFEQPKKKKPFAPQCERVALCFMHIISDYANYEHMAPAWDKARFARCAALFRETMDKTAELIAPKHCKTRMAQLRFANNKAAHLAQYQRIVLYAMLSTESIESMVREIDWVTLNVSEAMATCLRETVATTNTHFRVFGSLYMSCQ